MPFASIRSPRSNGRRAGVISDWGKQGEPSGRKALASGVRKRPALTETGHDYKQNRVLTHAARLPSNFSAFSAFNAALE